MLSIKNKVNYEYNSMFDILYIKLRYCYDSYGHEDDYGIVINHDYNTNEIVGFDIWDFKSRINNNEDIPLPIQIDLKEIYNEL